MAETNAATSQSLAADAVPVYIKAQLLEIAERDTVFYDLADEEDLPEGNGKVVQFSRYERLPLPSLPLSEGTTPTASPLTVSTVNGILDQWGGLVSLTDVGLMTIKHPLLRVANDLLGKQNRELVDREIQEVLMGTSNVVFAGGKTTRATLVAGDNMTGDLIRQVVATLRSLGAPDYDGGKYAGVVDPFVSMDIQKDPTFTNAASYSNIRALFNAELGTWIGVRWKESNLIPIISLLAGGDLTMLAVATAGGEVGFTNPSNIVSVVTRLDPVTLFETVVSAQTTTVTGANAAVSVQVNAAAVAGTYNIYVGLEGATIATLQTQLVHVASNDARVFFKSGTASGANRFVVQATGPVAPTAPPATGNVHTSYIFGKSSFGVTAIGPRMEATLTAPVASDSDPLKQRRKAGWKNYFKCIVKNTDRYRRLETLSAFN